jgi:hypothetical protein
MRRIVVEVARSLAVVALLAAALHVPSVNHRVGMWAVNRSVAPLGLEANADRASFNLLTLDARLEGLRLAPLATPFRPLWTSDSVVMRLTWSGQSWGLSIRELHIGHAWLDVGGAAGRQAWPQVILGTAGADRVSIGCLDVTGIFGRQAGAGASIGLRQLSATFSADGHGGLSGIVIGPRGSVVRSSGIAVGFTGVRLAALVRPRELTFKSLRADFPGGRLLAGGRIVLRNDGPRIDVEFDGRLQSPLAVPAWPVRWRAADLGAATGQLSGTIARPTISVELAGAAIEFATSTAAEPFKGS